MEAAGAFSIIKKKPLFTGAVYLGGSISMAASTHLYLFVQIFGKIYVLFRTSDSIKIKQQVVLKI